MMILNWGRNGNERAVAAAPARRQSFLGRYLSRARSAVAINMESLGASAKLRMYNAAAQGDWKSAQSAIAEEPEVLTAVLNEMGDKALHVAAKKGHTEFVIKMMEALPEGTELSAVDGRGRTALGYAAVSGNEALVKVLVEKKRLLLTMGNENPIYLAAACGRDGTTKYLIKTALCEDFEPSVWFQILAATVRCRMFECASDIMDKSGSVLARVFLHDQMRELLVVLARENDAAVTDLPQWLTFLDKVWNVLSLLSAPVRRSLLTDPVPLILEAVKADNIVFVKKIVSEDPSLLWQKTEEGHGICNLAIIYRSHRVFQSFDDLGCVDPLLSLEQDKDGNNLLHLAGKLAHPTRRYVTLDAPIQMKMELNCFKAVLGKVPECLFVMKNTMGLTPWQLFEEEHRGLLEKSQSWINAKAKSSMLVMGMLLPMAYGAIISASGSGEASEKFQSTAQLHGLASTFSLITLLLYWVMQNWMVVNVDFHFRVWLPVHFTIGMFGFLVSVICTTCLVISTLGIRYSSTKNWFSIATCLSIFVIVPPMIILFYYWATLMNLWCPKRHKIANFNSFKNDKRSCDEPGQQG